MNGEDAEAVTNDIISSVRDAIENAMVIDARSEYNSYNYKTAKPPNTSSGFAVNYAIINCFVYDTL